MIARLFAKKAPTAPVESAADIAASARWIEEALGHRGGYRFASGCPPTLLATSFGVCALELLGALDALPAARREELAAAIDACQLPSGQFRDPLHDDRMLGRVRKFPPLYIEWQESYFALHALDALGAKPRHPLGFVEPFTDWRVLEPWLKTLGFEDFWLSSNYLMFILLFFLQLEGEAAPSAHRLLDWLDARQDPQTGFWGTQQGASLFNGMAGAFHVYGYYQYLGRSIAHQAAAVRSTLTLQEPTGLFSDPGGGPCEDLDAIDILVKLEAAPEDEGRRDRALERAIAALRACRLPSGGYTWSSPQPGVKPKPVTYSGLSTMQVQSDAGDLWSQWFRPLAIALASQRLGRPLAWTPHYRRLPLLGWHRP